MSTIIWTLDPGGEKISAMHPKTLEYFPSRDIHRQQATLYRGAVTNIYKMKDGRYFHFHGKLVQM
jgi:hypothetical protein